MLLFWVNYCLIRKNQFTYTSKTDGNRLNFLSNTCKNVVKNTMEKPNGWQLALTYLLYIIRTREYLKYYFKRLIILVIQCISSSIISFSMPIITTHDSEDCSLSQCNPRVKVIMESEYVVWFLTQVCSKVGKHSYCNF